MRRDESSARALDPVDAVVVGSGPSGIAAATALIAAGREVTLVDTDETLDEVRATQVRTLAAHEPPAWDAGLRDQLAMDAVPPPRIPKLAFGSRFPYADDPAIVQQGTACLLSLARGGLSTVWGAAVLPTRAAELGSWPLDPGALTPHYAAVERMVGIAGIRDDLAEEFPFHVPPAPPLPASHQAVQCLARMERHRARLRADGIRFGRARLAVRGPDNPRDPRRCRLSGDCMGGCVYGAIWSSAQTLDVLLAGPRFRHVSGVRVRSLRCRAGGVEVQGRDPRGQPFAVRARRVFVAAGPLGTARLLLDALGAQGEPLPLRHQPYLLLPVLTMAAGPPDESLHALAQVFLEVIDPSLSARAIHAQVYTSSPRLRAHLRARIAGLGPLVPRVTSLLATRLGAMQVYLHDGDGEAMTLALGPGAPESAPLTVTAGGHGRSRTVFARLTLRFIRQADALGLVPLWPLAMHGVPGEGNHVGGSFPMRQVPTSRETDTLGMPPTLPGVHIVDASVLPTLAATTFTLTVMANAHRIAQTVAACEAERSG